MKRSAGLLALCVLGFASVGCTQSDPVVIMTTFGSAGSSSRATAIIALKMAECLGREVEVEFGVGVQGGVSAPANERTMLVSTIGNIALLPAISDIFGVDALIELRPVTRTTAVPDVLIVNAELGIDTLD